MKLKNRNTGVIGDLVAYDADKGIFAVKAQGGDRCYYYSLAALHEVWGDYEEPKVGYIIDPMVEDCVSEDDSGYEDPDVGRAKELGIWFETEKEAEEAVEKLKAWKRLKDNGFKFHDFIRDAIYYDISDEEIKKDTVRNDLDLLFGGGE